MGARRVVTGHEANGKAVFVSDEVVTPVSLALLPGMDFHLLWGSDTTGHFPDDGSKPEARRYFPPVNGSRFVFFSIPPVGGSGIPPDVDIGAAMEELEQNLPGLAEYARTRQSRYAHDGDHRLRSRLVGTCQRSSSTTGPR